MSATVTFLPQRRAQSSGCPSWCQLPAGHRLADDQVIHVRMIECVAGGAGSEPLWFAIEAGQDEAGAVEPVAASLFGPSEGLTLAELDDLIEALQRGRAALAEIVGVPR